MADIGSQLADALRALATQPQPYVRPEGEAPRQRYVPVGSNRIGAVDAPVPEVRSRPALQIPPRRSQTRGGLWDVESAEPRNTREVNEQRRDVSDQPYIPITRQGTAGQRTTDAELSRRYMPPPSQIPSRARVRRNLSRGTVRAPERLQLPLAGFSAYNNGPPTKLAQGGLGIILRTDRGFVMKGSLAGTNPTDEDLIEIASMVYLGGHPNVVKLLDIVWWRPWMDPVDSPKKIPYMVLEMAAGDVRQLITSTPSLTQDQRRDICLQMAIAIDFIAQMGVIHRDIKPANFLYWREQNGNILVKLSDLGRSRNSICSMHKSRGGYYTCGYMAPEGLYSEGHLVDSRADVWALGATFYLVMTGSILFGSLTCQGDLNTYYKDSYLRTAQFIGKVRSHESLKRIDTPLAKRWVAQMNTFDGHVISTGDAVMDKIISAALLVDNRPYPEQLLDMMCSQLGSNSVAKCSAALGTRFTLTCTGQLEVSENFVPMDYLLHDWTDAMRRRHAIADLEPSWSQHFIVNVRKIISDKIGANVRLVSPWVLQGITEYVVYYYIKSLQLTRTVNIDPSLRSIVDIVLDLRNIPNTSEYTNRQLSLEAMRYDLVTARVSDYRRMFSTNDMTIFTASVDVFFIHYAELQLSNKAFQFGVCPIPRSSDARIYTSQSDVAHVCYLLSCLCTGKTYPASRQLPVEWQRIGEALMAIDKQETIKDLTLEQRRELWVKYVSLRADVE